MLLVENESINVLGASVKVGLALDCVIAVLEVRLEPEMDLKVSTSLRLDILCDDCRRWLVFVTVIVFFESVAAHMDLDTNTWKPWQNRHGLDGETV